jgi:predicted CoA-binding protein
MLKQNLSDIKGFLEHKRLAMIGVSRNKKHFSRNLMAGMIKAGYDIIPVNHYGEELDGQQSVTKISKIDPPIDSVIIMLKKELALNALRDCNRAGVKNAWIYGMRGSADVDQKAIDFCEQHAINLVAGYCPYMFMEKSGLPHRIHGLIWKVIGLYPVKN